MSVVAPALDGMYLRTIDRTEQSDSFPDAEPISDGASHG